MKVFIAKLPVLATLAVLLFSAACSDDSPEPTTVFSKSGETLGEFTEAERVAVYDEAAEVLQDGSLSYSDRRNHLRLVRRSFGDNLFLAVIGSVPVYNAATDLTVSFNDYMTDFAGTFVGHPDAPITFDPVGAATRIYFTPTEDTIRRMTGIGLTDDLVRKHAALYHDEMLADAGAQATAKTIDAPPPAFVSRDPNLLSSYNQAKEILTSPSYSTEKARRDELIVLQDSIGQEHFTILLRYVPIVDLETGEVQTFDAYMRETAASFESNSGSPIDRDPVGAAMRIFFDPSADTISTMTGIGLSPQLRREATQQHAASIRDAASTFNAAVSQTGSQFDWNEEHRKVSEAIDKEVTRAAQDIDRAAQDISRDVDRAARDIDRAAQDISRDVDRAAQDIDRAAQDISRDVDRAVQDYGKAADDAVKGIISILGGN